MQQWARRYVKLTQPLGSACKRARIRQHIFSGSYNVHFLLATDAVPTLLHLSVFLFFAGLLILLRHISHTVFYAVVGWVVVCVVVYAYITFLPIFRPDSPHYAPISSLAWHVYADILYPFFVAPVKRWIRNTNIRPPAKRLLKRVEEKAEEIVWDNSPKLDAVILDSLLDTLGEDGAREKFFEAIPGFYNSQVVHVKDVNKNHSPMFFTKFRHTVNEFLDQTLSSDYVSESVRSRRLLTCLNATQSVLGGLAGMSITDKIIRSGDWNEMPPSPEIGYILRRWRNSTGSSRALIASCIIAQIIATVEKRDNTWKALARSQLEVTEGVLKGYLEDEDSVLLANLIKTTRLFFEKGLQFEGILWSISGFNVKKTLPTLQRDFCELWDKIAVEKSNSKRCIDCTFILGEICHVHDALHHTVPTTMAAIPASTSYALCPDRQSHHSANASQQVPAVALSSPSSPPSPLGVQSLLPSLQYDETNINPRPVLDTPSLPDPLPPPREVLVAPAMEQTNSAATSNTLATSQDLSVLDPGERDAQDLKA